MGIIPATGSAISMGRVRNVEEQPQMIINRGT